MWNNFVLVETPADTERSLVSISRFKTGNISDKSHSSLPKFRAVKNLISVGSFSFISGPRIVPYELGQRLNLSNFEYYLPICQLSFVNQKHRS